MTIGGSEDPRAEFLMSGWFNAPFRPFAKP